MDGPVPEKAPPPPMEKALVSDDWSHRKFGYEELLERIKKASPSDPIFAEYAPNLSRYVDDSNQSAQDAALSLLLGFMESYPPKQGGGMLAEFVGPICTALVDKAFGSRPANKKKATDAVVEFGGCDLGAQAMEVVIRRGFSHKLPKIIQPSVEVATDALKVYGPRVFPPRDVFKGMKPLFDHKDGKVRKGVMAYVQEAYRWMGPALKTVLPDLREAQMKEIEALFEGGEFGGAKPEKYPRFKGDNAAAEEEAQAAKTGVSAEEAALEFLEPVDVLKELAKDKEFWTGLDADAKQWKATKASLDKLIGMLDAPKVVPGDFSDVVRKLKGLLNHSNAMIVATSIQVMAKLGTALKREFSRYANMLLGTLIDMWKDKKPAINKYTTEALDTMAKFCFSVGDERFCGELLKGLKHKVGKVKLDTLAYLQRSIELQQSDVDAAKGCAQHMARTLVEMLDDPDGTARKVSAEILALLANTAGAPFMERFVSDVDPKKLNSLLGSGGGGGGSASSGAAKTTAAPAPAAASKPAAAAAAPAASSAKPAAGKPRSGGLVAKPATTGNKATSALKLMSRDEAVGLATERYGQELLTDLENSSWQKRKDALDKMIEMVRSGSVSDPTAEVTIVTLEPKLKETNFQVMNGLLKACGAAVVAAKEGEPNSQAVGIVVEAAVNKMADAKVKPAAAETLTDLVEGAGPKGVVEKATALGSTHKSPKVYEEVLVWLIDAVKVFGPQNLPVKTLVDIAKAAVDSTNPKVRSSALTLLAVLKFYIGDAFMNFLGSLPADKKDNVSNLCAQLKDMPEPSSWRIPRGGVAASSGGAAGDGTGGGAQGAEQGGAAAAGGGFDTSSMFEREDISEKMDSALLSQLKDKNWEKRQKALDEIERIIVAANKHIQPNVGGLLAAIKPCLTDANKNIAVQAISIVGLVVEATGAPNAIKHARSILPDLAPVLSDKKANVLDALLATYTKFLIHTSHKEMVVYLSKAMEVKNAEGRIGILNWITENFKNEDPLPDLKLLADPLVVTLSDRNAQVRTAAEGTLALVVKSIGVKQFRAVCLRNGVVPAVMTSIEEMLSKFGVEDDGAPPAQPATAAPTTTTTTTNNRLSASSDAPAAPQKTRSALVTPTKPKLAPQSKLDRSPATSRASVSRKVSTASMKGSPLRKTETVVRGGGGGGGGGSSPHGVELPPGGLFVSSAEAKQKRVASDRGVWKYTDDKFSPNHINDLRAQMQGKVHSELVKLMFSADFKHTSNALQQMQNVFEGPPEDCDMEQVVNCLDMIIKWLSLQLISTNTTVQSKTADTTFALFQKLESVGYTLSDPEARWFFPFLCNKLGNGKDNIRLKMRDVVALSTTIYPAELVFRELVAAMDSKSAKNRFECADACAELISSKGLGVVSDPVLILKLAKQVGDNAVRPAILKCIVEVYIRMTEADFNLLLAPIKGNERSLIDERVKRHEPLPPNENGTPEPQQQPPPQQQQPQQQAQRPQHQRQPSQPTYNTAAPTAARAAPAPAPAPAPTPTPTDNYRRDSRPLTEDEMVALYDRLTGPIVNLPPLQQVDFIFRKMDDKVPSEEAVIYLRHLSTLLSSPQDQLILGQSEHIDFIVETLMSHLQMVFEAEVFDARLCKYLIYTMMTIMEGKLARGLSLDVVTVVMFELLMMTLVFADDANDQMMLLVRAINAAVVSYVDNASPTVVLCFMIRLVHAPPADPTTASNDDLMAKFQATVLRYLIKQVKKFSETLPELDLEVLLPEIDHFLVNYAPHTNEEGMDLPNRIVKTIVHTIVKTKGEEVLVVLQRCTPQGDTDSTLVHLVKILLAKQQQQHQQGSGDQQQTPLGDSLARLKMLHSRVAQLPKTDSVGGDTYGIPRSNQSLAETPTTLSQLKHRLQQLKNGA